MSAYPCMTPDELALWQKRTYGYAAQIPCRDCPVWYAEQEAKAGRCHRKPMKGRQFGVRGPAPVYATDEERIAARRRTWREAKARERERLVLGASAVGLAGVTL